MATTTHRGITYTSSGSATLSVQLDLPLQAGVDQDDTTWLTSYPGALTSFAARQTDGANRISPRLVCLGVGALAEAETVTLSGEANAIISAVVSISINFIARNIAKRNNLLVDLPDRSRKFHKRPTPLTGGISIFISLLISAKLYIDLNELNGFVPLFSSMLCLGSFFMVGVK